MLNLSENSTQRLTEGVFEGLTSCSELDMSSNRISNISLGSFKGLDRLAILKLRSNSLQILAEGVFEGLPFCTELDLSSNSISNVETRAFRGLNRLTTLKLYNNALSQIDSTILTGLKYLETLGLSDNYITTIFPEAFSGLLWLQTLHLGNNYLSNIQGSMWVGFHSLEHLTLSGNRLTQIPRHGISHMPVLKKLGLSSNQLTTLRSNIFNPDDYPDSNGRPLQLKMYLYDNPFWCDRALCWLKNAQESGSIIFAGSGPKCANLYDASLEEIELNCTSGFSFFYLFSVRQRNCGKVIFSRASVSHSFHSGVGGGYSPTSPPIQWTWNTTGYGWQAGGTHPTGMLSCSFCKHHFITMGFFFISTLFHLNENRSIETCLQFTMFSADIIMTTNSQESENSMTTTPSDDGSETAESGNDKRTQTHRKTTVIPSCLFVAVFLKSIFKKKIWCWSCSTNQSYSNIQFGMFKEWMDTIDSFVTRTMFHFISSNSCNPFELFIKREKNLCYAYGNVWLHKWCVISKQN